MSELSGHVPESERKGLKPVSVWGVRTVVHAVPFRSPRVSPLPRGQAGPAVDTGAHGAWNMPFPSHWTLSDAVFSSELRGARGHFLKLPAQCFSGAYHSSRSPQLFQLGSSNPPNPGLSRCAHMC